MKRPEYVAAVTAVYRQALDTHEVTQEMREALYKAFNRQGFTDGYYTNRVNSKMFGIHQEEKQDNSWLSDARQTYETGEHPLVPVRFLAKVTVDGSSVSVRDPEGRTCTAEGPRPERAVNLSLTDEMLTQRVIKTGGTPYYCAGIQTQVDPGLIISASAINTMRRDALNQLTALRARREERTIRKPKPVPAFKGPKGLPGLTVQVASREQLTKQLLKSETAMLYVPVSILRDDPRLCQALLQRGKLTAVLPRVVHDGELPALADTLRKLMELGLRDVLVGNLGLLIPMRELGLRIRGDFGLNIFNSFSMNVMRSLELASVTASFEMTLPQIRDMSKAVDTELIAYGRLPLMITEHCLIRNRTGECSCGQGAVKLVDKTGADFPVIRDGDTCRSVLLNGRKLSWLDRQDDLAKLGLWAIRLSFTTENSREVDRVLEDYLNPAPFDPGSCTRGLYLRGVE